MPIKDKERWERLAALGAKREIPTPEGQAKMSAVILRLAEPLMKQHGKTAKSTGDHHADHRSLEQIDVPARNATDHRKDLMDLFVPKDGSAEAVGVAVEVMDIVAKRREKLFPTFTRSSWTTR